jgi:hypothetical protein
MKQVSYSFKLKLLDTIKVHPVFYTEKLCKDLDNPLLRQVNLKPLPLELEDGKMEYKVQKVLTVRLIHSRLKYKVQ